MSDDYDQYISEDLAGAKDVVQGPNYDYQFGKMSAEKLPNDDASIGDDKNNILINTAKSMMPSIQTAARAFVEGIPTLLKGLDEVAKYYPFIAPAILTFRLVYELEKKRSSNEQKVKGLFVEIRDMLSVLLCLRPASNGPSPPAQYSVEKDLQELIHQTAEDIKQCGNTCDAYMSKHSVAKFLTATGWNTKFVGLIRTLRDRREKLQFALSALTHKAMKEISETIGRIESKIDTLAGFFENDITPEQASLYAWVEKHGGREVVRNDKSLVKALMTNQYSMHPKPLRSAPLRGPKSAMTAGRQSLGQQRFREAQEDDLTDLWNQLEETPDHAVSQNLTLFQSKLDMQKKELEALREAVDRMGDRILEAMDQGQHKKILDPFIGELWGSMTWRGSVKARRFVLALRDRYLEVAHDRERMDTALDDGLGDHEPWAVEVITANLKALQPIIEAIDDDNSDLISIAEVNAFTVSRPPYWSMAHWLAFWSIGWQMSMTLYCSKIDELVGKMFALKTMAHPANHLFLDEYLAEIWPVTMLTESLNRDYGTPFLRNQFRSYVDDEEQRIRDGLETFKYEIDNMETLKLITGTGRIEKSLFPLLYLLLLHDLEIVLSCQTKLLEPDEFDRSVTNMEWVFYAVQLRYDFLEGIYKERNMDPMSQFRLVACEIFECWDNPAIFGRQPMRARRFPEYIISNEIEILDHQEKDQEDDQEAEQPGNGPEDEFKIDAQKDSDPQMKILQKVQNNALRNHTWSRYDWATSDGSGARRDDDSDTKRPVDYILGVWNGFLTDEEDSSMVKLTFSQGSHEDFIVEEMHGDEGDESSYHIIDGKIQISSEGNHVYSFRLVFSKASREQFFRGFVTKDGRVYWGTWNYEFSNEVHEFAFTRHSRAIPTFRPSSTEFDRRKIRGLWQFAYSRVLDYKRSAKIKRVLLVYKGHVRRRYLDLMIRQDDFGHPLNEAENQECARYEKLFSGSPDMELCQSLYEHRVRSACFHWRWSCDQCHGTIGGVRIVCMDCDVDDTIDLCDDPRCSWSNAEGRSDLTKPHVPSHSVFKLRAVLHRREFGRMDADARDALKKATGIIEHLSKAKESISGTIADTLDRPLLGVSPDLEDNSSTDIESGPPVCIGCQNAVTYPCWYCITCSAYDDIFICDDCDAQGGITWEDHDKTHPLVSCLAKKPAADVEQRLSTVEERLENLNGSLAQIDDRLARMEELITSFVEGSRGTTT